MRFDPAALWRLLTSDEGRATRKEYWLFFLASIGFAMLLLALPVVGLPAVMPVAISLLLLYPSYCVIAKRLQDLNIPGQWAIFIALVAAIDAILIAAGPGGNRYWLLSLARSVWWWIALLNMAAFFVIGLMPGSRGVNPFGPERL